MDDYGLELSGLDPDTTAELRRLKRQQMMADELAKRGMQPLQGQMVGGVYVRPSVFQGLAGLANAWAAKNEQDKIDEGYKSLGEKRKAQDESERQKIIDAMAGTPEIPIPEDGMGPGRPAIPASRQNIMNTMLQSRIPEYRKSGMQMMQSGIEQQDFRDAIKGAMGGGQLTGFEPMQNGVPGQQGMVGDPQNLIQDIAMNPDMSNEDKQAAIAQIRQQSAGAGGGQIDPTKLIFSGNAKAAPIGQFLIGQQDKKDAAKQTAAYKLILEREKASERSRLSKEHDERIHASRMGIEATKKENMGLPTKALAMQMESQDAIATSGSIVADLNALNSMIDSKQIDLSLFNNWVSRGRNLAGLSTAQSANFNTFERTIERLRNDSLRLNKGVQTEGDSQRALNELVGSLNDPQVAKQRLREIAETNERGIDLHKQRINTIRSNYGLAPIEKAYGEKQKAAVGTPSSGGTVLKFDAQGNPIP